MDIYAYGDRIKQAREACGMTQGELSKRVGITQSAISKLERGNSGAALDTIRAIAKALDVSLDELTRALDADRAKALNMAADPRLTIECDMTAVPGLRALAADGALCVSLAITPDEWRRLRSVPLPDNVPKAGYLQLLVTLRSIAALPSDDAVTES